MKKMYFLGFAMLMGFVVTTNAQNFKTIKKGNQVWMAENLNEAVPGSWWYNDDPSTGAKYGRLYTWEAARSSSPAGWRLPTGKD